ncbi:ANTAR domain-containing response regulator [Alloscardovia macacae]|uniref:Transcriptional regulator n=1 Tax=Alloscardovia macacae TaxID=1160091 RepID=A0A261F5A2_9BIFI|nr:response regulator [Alloscardovia macacae]OZG54290.1 transcriptional regulator [Alloscardovia macacae]
MATTQNTKRTVVVAEDEALNRLDIIESLNDGGYEVVGEAANGQEAVDIVREKHPDIVVMDVKMPVKDGITAAREINEEFLAPVVMLTAFSQKDLVAEAIDAGVMAYVVKPFVPDRLFPALEVAFGRFEQMEKLRERMGEGSAEGTSAAAEDEIAALREQVEDLKNRLESRKHVDRAKGLLMENMGLSEQEAFRWIQKTSMDRRLTMLEVADAVIAQIEGE